MGGPFDPFSAHSWSAYQTPSGYEDSELTMATTIVIIHDNNTTHHLLSDTMLRIYMHYPFFFIAH